MSRQPAEPLFLARQSYRRRRLGDAARLVPVLGIILFVLPVLWSDAARTAGGLIFLFTVWALLIVLMAVVVRRLSARVEGSDAPQDLDEG